MGFMTLYAKQRRQIKNQYFILKLAQARQLPYPPTLLITYSYDFITSIV